MLTFQDNFVLVISKILKPVDVLPDPIEQDVTYDNPYSKSENIIELKMNDLGKLAFFFHQNLQNMIVDLKPLLESFDRGVLDPLMEMTSMIKKIYGVMQKRDNKMIDYDRYRTTVAKYEEKGSMPGGRSLPDEQAYHKYGELYLEASRQYNYFNEMLKSDIKILLSLRHEFISLVMEKAARIQLIVYQKVYDLFLIAAQHNNQIDLNIDMDHEFKDLWNLAEEVLKEIEFSEEAPTSGKKFLGSIRGKKPAPMYKPSSAYSKGNRGSYLHGTAGNEPLPPSSSGNQPLPPSSAGTSRYPDTAPYDNVHAQPPSYDQLVSESNPGYQAAATNFATNVATGAANNVIASEKSKFNSYLPQKQQPQYGQQEKSASMYGGVPQPPLNVPARPQVNPPVVYVKALYDYTSQSDQDLSFKAGDMIELLERTESGEDWWTGKINGKVGLIPSNYVTMA
ncbi:Regulator of cytoskeleton and endocytosis [Smittium mucronatum]|uniref:Regulator of cytoskeleton and endocytosis n=1 Tax=Smittium mucronatum TaxID=133383 RepID=A0A1R0GLC7_9FUNG|nr:Regulator of cytoskeleton and endocytosis [Smittium mucronatum]